MKMKNMWKRFWTLDVHNHAGFTLVELIIVIAILAILSTGAIAGYSAYVESANKTADQALIAEIKNVLTLHYYSYGISGSDYVILSVNEDASAGSNGFIRAALVEAYGENWPQALKLKYKDWQPAYQDSSFSGNEIDLLNKVDSLTDMLGEVLAEMPGLVGTSFESFLSGLEGVDSSDPDAVADAAVLYVAQNAAQEANREAIVEYMTALTSKGNPTNAAQELVPLFGGSYVAAAAGLYAVTQAYCQYEASNGNARPLEILNEQSVSTDGITADNQIKAVENVLATFGAIASEVVGNSQYHLNEYFSPNGRVVQDTNAYLDMMQTVNSAQNEIIANTTLGSENAFSNSEIISNMFQAIADGGIMIKVYEDNGIFVIEDPLEQ